MVEEHVCLHEKQLQEQSVTIGKLDAEMAYKKEKLDDLKEDNRRMEKKIDAGASFFMTQPVFSMNLYLLCINI